MATPAAGVTRRRLPRLDLALEPGPGGEAMRRNQQKLEAAIRRLEDQLVFLEDKLARRMNEMLVSGTLANRPAAAIQDRIYFATDQAPGSRFYYDSGTAWLAP